MEQLLNYWIRAMYVQYYNRGYWALLSKFGEVCTIMWLPQAIIIIWNPAQPLYTSYL